MCVAKNTIVSGRQVLRFRLIKTQLPSGTLFSTLFLGRVLLKVDQPMTRFFFPVKIHWASQKRTSDVQSPSGPGWYHEIFEEAPLDLRNRLQEILQEGAQPPWFWWVGQTPVFFFWGGGGRGRVSLRFSEYHLVICAFCFFGPSQNGGLEVPQMTAWRRLLARTSASDRRLGPKKGVRFRG